MIYSLLFDFPSISLHVETLKAVAGINVVKNCATNFLLTQKIKVMENLVLTTQRELQSIISDAVKQAVKSMQPKEQEKPKPLMNVPEAVKFINDLGLKMGKSQFYKYTMKKEIEAVIFGKKLLFKKEALEQWANSKLKSNSCNDIAKAVADNIKQ